MDTKNKTAFACFFPVVPVNMGSAEVCFSFFDSWPSKNKCLFQLTPKPIKRSKKLISIHLKKNNPLNKIFSLPKMISEIYNYLKNSSKPILIIEGPSWIGYSFILFFFLKRLVPNLKTIYHSHSIEYEIRKKNNFIISFLTKFFEKIIFNKIDYPTAVSRIEAKKIVQLYNVSPYILPNGVNIKRLKIKNFSNVSIKNFPKKFILFCGSYEYPPNRKAINILVNDIMPNLVKDYPNLKLVLTGGGVNFKKKWLLNFGIVKKEKMIFALKKCVCTVIPIFEGYGSRIKIIEALMLGTVVISTVKGIEGIDYNKKIKPPYVSNNINKITEITKNILKKKKIRKNSQNIKNVIKSYSMEKLATKFYKHVN